MSIYDDVRVVASEVMSEFKQGEIRYKETTYGTPAAPDEAGAPTTTTSDPLDATARPVSTKYVDGSHIVRSDKQVVIPNDGKATPQMEGFVIIDGVNHKIVEIMPRPAAGEPVVWTVVVRR